jgi:hypothetical protein
VAVFPLDVHAVAGGEVHFDRLGIDGGGHRVSIAWYFDDTKRLVGSSSALGGSMKTTENN